MKAQILNNIGDSDDTENDEVQKEEEQNSDRSSSEESGTDGRQRQLILIRLSVFKTVKILTFPFLSHVVYLVITS